MPGFSRAVSSKGLATRLDRPCPVRPAGQSGIVGALESGVGAWQSQPGWASTHSRLSVSRACPRRRSAGVNVRHDWKMIRGEPGGGSRVGEDPSQRLGRMNPDAIERHDRPEHRERRWTRRPAETAIEHVHDRAARQPVVEVAEHHEQRVAHRVEILEDLPHLEPAFAERAGRGAPRARAPCAPPTSIVAASAPRGSRRSIDRSIRCTSTIGCRVSSALPKQCVTVCRVGPSAHS